MILVLTILAAWLRLYRLGPSLQFLGDQGRDALVMHRLLTSGDLPFIGPITSVGGFYLGPLYYYLMAPWLWLARFNPVGPAVATAILGALTVPVLYWVGKKLFSHRVGLWAAGLYALAYIPISETRSAWNPNPMPLAALGILYGFYLANYQNKPKGLLLAAVSLGAALQLHYMIVFLAPLIIWQVILARKHFRQLLAGLAILLVMMLPLFLFEIKNNWLNVKGLSEFLGKHSYGSLDLWQVAKNTIGRSEQAIGMVLGFGRNFNLLRTWLTRAFLLGIVWLLARKPKPGLILSAVWLLSSIITLAVYQDNIYPHYLGFLFPMVFILTAAILAKLPKLFLPAFAVLFLYYNLPPVNVMLRQTGNLKNVAATAEYINQDIKTNHYDQVNLALIDGTRDYPAMNFRYFLTLTGTKILAIDQYPQTQILYLISPYPQTEILAQPMWEIQALLPAEVVESWEWPDRENIYKIKRL